MKTLVIIPARYASTRFIGKPLALIRGKTMIERVYENCQQANEVDKVIVATDDERIYKHLKNKDANVVMTAKHHQNGTERIAEVARQYPQYKLVINVQGDEPCVHPEQIQELIQLMKTQVDTPIGTLAQTDFSKSDLLNENKVKVGFSTHAIYFSRKKKDISSPFLGIHVGMYAFHRTVLLKLVQLPPTLSEQTERLEQLRWIDNGYSIAVRFTSFESPSVDVPEDITAVEKFIDLLAAKTIL